MSLDNFYKVLTVKDGSDPNLKLIECEINKDHQVFEGHFPGNPVMPGVCMLHIVKEMAENCVGKSLFMEQCTNVKFLSIMNPQLDSKLWLEIFINEDGDKVRIKGNAKSQDIIVLKLSVVYRSLN